MQILLGYSVFFCCCSVQISPEKSELTNGKGEQDKDELSQTLESMIAIEDPYNGEMVVRSIRKGFIDAKESELDLWQI